MVAGRIVVSNIERYGMEPPRCRVISTGSRAPPSSVGASGDHGEGVDGRDAEPVQVPQQLVLAQGGAFRQLLDGDDLVAGACVAHDVPGDTARQRHEVVVGPLLQGEVPRQFEQECGVLGVGGADLQCHGSTVLVPLVIVTSL